MYPDALKLRPVGAYISSADCAVVRNLGNGNVSAGVRYALRRAQSLPPAPFAAPLPGYAGRGRPATLKGGHTIVAYLLPADLATAKHLGSGNASAGIRYAIACLETNG